MLFGSIGLSEWIGGVAPGVWAGVAGVFGVSDIGSILQQFANNLAQRIYEFDLIKTNNLV